MRNLFATLVKTCGTVLVSSLIFVPTGVLAFCGWQPEGGCVPCPPVYGSWQLVYCPELSNTPGVSPSIFCQPYGAPLIMPTVTKPTYDPGKKQRMVITVCNDTTQEGTIIYTAGDVQWDPPLPSVMPNNPRLVSQAYVMIANSDPGLCNPDSSWRFNIGNCTWGLVGVLHSDSTFYSWTPEWAAEWANLLGGRISLPITISPIVGYDLSYSRYLCCNDGTPATAAYDKRRVNVGTQSCNVDVGTVTIKEADSSG